MPPAQHRPAAAAAAALVLLLAVGAPRRAAALYAFPQVPHSEGLCSRSCTTGCGPVSPHFCTLAAAAAATLTRPSRAAPTSPTSHNQQVVPGGACIAARVEFTTNHFEYRAGYASNVELPLGCSPGDLQ